MLDGPAELCAGRIESIGSDRRGRAARPAPTPGPASAVRASEVGRTLLTVLPTSRRADVRHGPCADGYYYGLTLGPDRGHRARTTHTRTHAPHAAVYTARRRPGRRVGRGAAGRPRAAAEGAEAAGRRAWRTSLRAIAPELPPQSYRLRATASERSPQSYRLRATASERPPQSRKRSSRRVLLAMLRVASSARALRSTRSAA